MTDAANMLPVLKQSLLFRNMEDREILEALETIASHRRVYPKRTLVMRDGDPMDQVGVILSGNLHLFHIDANGNSNLMENLGKGESLGLLNAIGGYRLHISAETTEQTEILFLNVSQLLRKNVLTAPVQIRFLQNLTLAVVSRPTADPKIGGQHPPLYPGPPAGLFVGPVSSGWEPHLLHSLESAGSG